MYQSLIWIRSSVGNLLILSTIMLWRPAPAYICTLLHFETAPNLIILHDQFRSCAVYLYQIYFLVYELDFSFGYLLVDNARYAANTHDDKTGRAKLGYYYLLLLSCSYFN